MIELTPEAAQQILIATRQRADDGELALRIAAWPSRDGSVEYGMGFDEEREGDLAVCIEGVDLLIGVASRAFLVGTVLDFVEYEPGDYRFIFIPPAPDDLSGSLSSCGSGGCGSCGGAR